MSEKKDTRTSIDPWEIIFHSQTIKNKQPQTYSTQLHAFSHLHCLCHFKNMLHSTTILWLNLYGIMHVPWLMNVCVGFLVDIEIPT